MHLLDVPKLKRSARPYWVIATLLCSSVVGIAGYLFNEALQNNAYRPPRESASVKWVTVSVRTAEKWFGCDCKWEDVPVTEYQMPLMELYDELCEIEDKAESYAERIPPLDFKQHNAFGEQMYLNAKKEFMQKYGLTQKQVAMIKRDGYRIKHGIKQIAPCKNVIR